MIFVTGGTGLLGSHVLVELLKRGKTVRALRRSSSNMNMVNAVFQHFFKTASDTYFNKIKWVEGDILNVPLLLEHTEGCTEVYHCAALVSFKKRDFKRLMKINKEGTANVVNVCLAKNVKKLCHVSSTAAIGRSATKEFYDEDNKWVNDRSNSNYAISKYSAENEVWRGREEGLDVVIVNPSVILGVGDWNSSSLSLFKTVKQGLKFYTPGTNAFVDARDVAFILCELAERNIVNERFLVISENVPFKALFTKIARAFNVKPPHIKVKKWMTAIAWRLEGFLAFLFGKTQNITKETAKSAMQTHKYSNEKVKKALDYEFIPVEQAVNDAAAFFKAYHELG